MDSISILHCEYKATVSFFSISLLSRLPNRLLYHHVPLFLFYLFLFLFYPELYRGCDLVAQKLWVLIILHFIRMKWIHCGVRGCGVDNTIGDSHSMHFSTISHILLFLSIFPPTFLAISSELMNAPK